MQKIYICFILYEPMVLQKYYENKKVVSKKIKRPAKLQNYIMLLAYTIHNIRIIYICDSAEIKPLFFTIFEIFL